MRLNVQNPLMQPHQQTAQQLLAHSSVLKQLFQDQWFYLWGMTPKNIFTIDPVQHRLSILDGWVQIEFKTPQNQFAVIHDDFIQIIVDPKLDLTPITTFVLSQIRFLIRDLKAQHPLFLQSKMQLFRQLVVEEVFRWVDGENRIEQYLYNLSVADAQSLDQIMIAAGYYHEPHLTEFTVSGIEIPLNVELNFKHLSLVNSVLGDDFLSVSQMIPVYDHLCFSAHEFIPAALFRMIETTCEDDFNLEQVIALQSDFKLLYQHAQQQPHLLALSQWVKRGYWQHQDIFSKNQFLQPHSNYWDERISTEFALFHSKRAVNWLFKQHVAVLDWVAKHLDDVNVRIAVTALSFTDTSQIHSHVIIETLQYFKAITGRIFIQECCRFAEQQHWFDLNTPDDQQRILYYQHHYALKRPDRVSAERPHRIEISDSILYLDEWLHVLSLVAKDDAKIMKDVYQRLSRVMQAYMLFLQKIVQDLPDALVPYMHPELQQDPKFQQLLKQHQISIDEFRQRFKHAAVQFNRVTSVFDSYVADFLVDYFYHYTTLAKNVTWTGLYHQAVRWHQQIDFEDTLNKLRQRIHKNSWRRVSPQEIMFTERWKFVELNSLEQIIHESVHYKHCLALSYTERIADGEYVAFHMTNLQDEQLQLTLGCFFRFEQLYFDQLRLPNNEQADRAMQLDALAFIQNVNQHLIWDFKEPKVQ